MVVFGTVGLGAIHMINSGEEDPVEAVTRILVGGLPRPHADAFLPDGDGDGGRVIDQQLPRPGLLELPRQGRIPLDRLITPSRRPCLSPSVAD
ncbi:hypothetical protein NYP18_04200 [Corynebacterium sp. YIM 101645]|uniref:Uncharacterized protein n=1 Tax=Corynebacterium lemuris TaxID=1859292 RepID=A0ABT2FV73_9CORY|nr:hypothetical protein [Corynebacterium lemuris]MCS5478854.1 hypothetical protein [Corynebacterium lemuris]